MLCPSSRFSEAQLNLIRCSTQYTKPFDLPCLDLSLFGRLLLLVGYHRATAPAARILLKAFIYLEQVSAHTV